MSLILAWIAGVAVVTLCRLAARARRRPQRRAERVRRAHASPTKRIGIWLRLFDFIWHASLLVGRVLPVHRGAPMGHRGSPRCWSRHVRHESTTSHRAHVACRLFCARRDAFQCLRRPARECARRAVAGPRCSRDRSLGSNLKARARLPVHGRAPAHFSAGARRVRSRFALSSLPPRSSSDTRAANSMG